MKQAHKRKTLGPERNGRELMQHKRKHNSTATFLKEDESRLVVFEVIEYLMDVAFQKESRRAKLVAEAMQTLVKWQAYDTLYLSQDFPEEKEILCQEDAEPPHQENRTLEVVKTHLKKSSRRLHDDSQEISEADGSRLTLVEMERRDREGIIQKLKREYSMILQSKYFSESTPIGESRAYFAESDTPQIANLRRNFGKAVVKKQARHKGSFIEEEIRKKHKLNTIYKRSRDFVETIDPTMTNSIYLSQVEQTASQRTSVALPPAEPQVVVKLSKFKEISNSVKTKVEMASEKNLPQPQGGNNTKFINLISEQEREALKQRVERSFHCDERMKFKEVSETERKPKLNSSISVSFLPRIARV